MATRCGVSSYVQGLILLVIACMLGVGLANTTIVGGSEHWRIGFNYNEWAFQNGPFYLNDTLVFKYDPPNNTTPPHSVYLLPNFWSFRNCDLRKAKLVASPEQGGGEGFKFVIKTWKPYFFACGEHDGIHCRLGLMKFVVLPIPHCRGG